MSSKTKSRVFYYDTRTGRRVSKATWKRSKAQGGTRYKRKPLTRKRKPGTPGKKKHKFDPARAVKKVLDELNLPGPGGPFQGQKRSYSVVGDVTEPPEYLVSIRISNDEGGKKEIRKRIRYDEYSDIVEFDPSAWETDETDY